jgi:hypothetical protein
MARIPLRPCQLNAVSAVAAGSTGETNRGPRGRSPRPGYKSIAAARLPPVRPGGPPTGLFAVQVQAILDHGDVAAIPQVDALDRRADTPRVV